MKHSSRGLYATMNHLTPNTH